MLVVAILVPAQAHAFKPKLIYVRATEDSQGVHFAVKVRMDQEGRRSERKVAVIHDGDRKRAHPLEDPPLSHWETGAYSIPSRNCYRVTVIARNEFGKTIRNVRASMIGTNGCN